MDSTPTVLTTSATLLAILHIHAAKQAVNKEAAVHLAAALVLLLAAYVLL